MKRAQKKVVAEEFQAGVQSSQAVFLTDYRGLTAKQMTELRMALSRAGSRLKVVKNRLALRAFEGEMANHLAPIFDEMTAVALTQEDVAGAAKALTEFAKANEALKIKGGVLEGKLISIAEIKALSSLPSRDELLAQLLAVWAAVPTGFVRVLNALPSGWVNVLDAMRRKKEGGE